jgi:hypothetical protein
MDRKNNTTNTVDPGQEEQEETPHPPMKTPSAAGMVGPTAIVAHVALIYWFTTDSGSAGIHVTAGALPRIGVTSSDGGAHVEMVS